MPPTTGPGVTLASVTEWHQQLELKENQDALAECRGEGKCKGKSVVGLSCPNKGVGRFWKKIASL